MTSKPRFSGNRVLLGEVCFASKKRNTSGVCTDVYSVTNSHGFIPSKEYFSKEVFSAELRTYKVVDRNMIAYNPSRINVGSVALQDEREHVVVSPLYVVFSVDQKRVLPAYLVRYLKSRPGLEQIAFQSLGTVRSNLKFTSLCRMDMDIPPLEHQRCRLDILLSIEKLISLCKAQLSLLDTLVKSRFIEMFGDARHIGSLWEMRELSSCVRSIDSGKSPNCKNEARTGENHGVLKLSALSTGRFLPSENKAMLDGESVPESKAVIEGDILVARKNTPDLVGTCVLIREPVQNLMFPDLIFRMHPNHTVDAEYLCALLSGPSYSGKVRELAHGSAKSMSNIPKTSLSKLPIPLPPLPLQREFAAFVAGVAKLEFAARKQIEELQTLYDSLAQEYFG